MKVDVDVCSLERKGRQGGGRSTKLIMLLVFVGMVTVSWLNSPYTSTNTGSSLELSSSSSQEMWLFAEARTTAGKKYEAHVGGDQRTDSEEGILLQKAEKTIRTVLDTVDYWVQVVEHGFEGAEVNIRERNRRRKRSYERDNVPLYYSRSGRSANQKSSMKTWIYNFVTGGGSSKEQSRSRSKRSYESTTYSDKDMSGEDADFDIDGSFEEEYYNIYTQLFGIFTGVLSVMSRNIMKTTILFTGTVLGPIARAIVKLSNPSGTIGADNDMEFSHLNIIQVLDLFPFLKDNPAFQEFLKLPLLTIFSSAISGSESYTQAMKSNGSKLYMGVYLLSFSLLSYIFFKFASYLVRGATKFTILMVKSMLIISIVWCLLSFLIFLSDNPV